MVGPEHGDKLRLLVIDQVDVLVHGIGRALEPLRPHAHLRRDHGDEMRPDDRGQDPVLAHMLDKRLGLVLHQEVNGIDVRVHEVAQDKIHDPVPPAEGDGRL